ncbi:luciferase family protein [Mucilaginibacter sp. CAU 1740]|uniref:luciferase domain-containing protein n=1 Tax=Mucilaginibacter sp. CAU 1740 TaxID=3140365 RepID=UPI00325BCFF8
MFLFVRKYLGFLKFIPGLAIVFDGLLKLGSFVTKPVLLDWMDKIEAAVITWPQAIATTHKYGGLQFNYINAEIGHIHGNGLLDMPLSRKVKAELMADGRIEDHHTFKNTGWISFYIRNYDDVTYALDLLRLGYERLDGKNIDN